LDFQLARSCCPGKEIRRGERRFSLNISRCTCAVEGELQADWENSRRQKVRR
jgi:hypothetical protein